MQNRPERRPSPRPKATQSSQRAQTPSVKKKSGSAGKTASSAKKNSPTANRAPAAKKKPTAARPASQKAPVRIDSILPFIPKKWRRAVALTLLDVLMIGVGLVVFAYFHHVRPQALSTDDVIVISRPSAAQVTQTPEPTVSDAPDFSAEAAVTPTATPAPTVDPNDWGAKFADQFTEGNVETTETGYRSKNVSISISRHSGVDEGGDPQVWFVADIYIRDIDSLKTAFAENVYGKGYKEWPAFIANEHAAILAISGDYYGAREKGVVIRNGSVYRTETFKDVCIIYYDGVMETMSAGEFDADAAIERGAYQAFSFGPALLDADGKVKEAYDTEINDPNPRCAIGYFEPGHYCFVVADGRDFDYSEGLEMHELAQIFEDLGCAAAYNLDGGATATMIFMDKIVNNPYDNGRKVSDIIYIGEVAE